MSDSSPLQRAHALSAQASLLLRPPNSHPQTSHQALEAYRQAAELFEQSGVTSGDDGAKKTLEMLTVQHRKLARDLERRIGGGLGGSPQRASSGFREGLPGASGGLFETAGGMNDAPAGSLLSPTLGIPPFALRPSLSHSSQSQPARPPIEVPAHSLSPLYSSSSSSDAPEDSFLHLDTLDPFSRFWGALENMLGDISKPVAFASAPLTVEMPAVDELVRRARKGNRGKRKEVVAEGKGKGKEEPPSPSESFYVVSSLKSDEPETPCAPSKTPEELALENESLRSSLDALASHAQTLEQANKALKQAGDEREKMMRSVVVGVRREAQKAKAGQELMRSQLLSSLSAPKAPRLVAKGGGGSGVMPDIEAGSPTGEGTPLDLRCAAGWSAYDKLGLRKKVRELEEEVKNLKFVNEKQKGQMDKYKDRFDKLKVNARAKREAKLAPTGEEEGSKRG